MMALVRHSHVVVLSLAEALVRNCSLASAPIDSKSEASNALAAAEVCWSNPGAMRIPYPFCHPGEETKEMHRRAPRRHQRVPKETPRRLSEGSQRLPVSQALKRPKGVLDAK